MFQGDRRNRARTSVVVFDATNDARVPVDPARESVTSAQGGGNSAPVARWCAHRQASGATCDAPLGYPGYTLDELTRYGLTETQADVLSSVDGFDYESFHAAQPPYAHPRLIFDRQELIAARERWTEDEVAARSLDSHMGLFHDESYGPASSTGGNFITGPGGALEVLEPFKRRPPIAVMREGLTQHCNLDTSSYDVPEQQVCHLLCMHASRWRFG